MTQRLFTRCSHCNTVFKVLPEQLAVANGKVRCGACFSVFEAAKHLVEPVTKKDDDTASSLFPMSSLDELQDSLRQQLDEELPQSDEQVADPLLDDDWHHHVIDEPASTELISAEQRQQDLEKLRKLNFSDELELGIVQDSVDVSDGFDELPDLKLFAPDEQTATLPDEAKKDPSATQNSAETLVSEQQVMAQIAQWAEKDSDDDDLDLKIGMALNEPFAETVVTKQDIAPSNLMEQDPLTLGDELEASSSPEESAPEDANLDEESLAADEAVISFTEHTRETMPDHDASREETLELAPDNLQHSDFSSLFKAQQAELADSSESPEQEEVLNTAVNKSADESQSLDADSSERLEQELEGKPDELNLNLAVSEDSSSRRDYEPSDNLTEALDSFVSQKTNTQFSSSLQKGREKHGSVFEQALAQAKEQQRKRNQTELRDPVIRFELDDATKQRLDAQMPTHDADQEVRRLAHHVLYGLGCVLLVAFLGVQYLWFHRDQLSQNVRLRPLVSSLCQVVGCELPFLQDVSAIKVLGRKLSTHPLFENVLVIDLFIFNQAEYIQNYPVVEVVFTDFTGNQVASRRFHPYEYLDKQDQNQKLLSQKESSINLQMFPPKQGYASFSINLF